MPLYSLVHVYVTMEYILFIKEIEIFDKNVDLEREWWKEKMVSLEVVRVSGHIGPIVSQNHHYDSKASPILFKHSKIFKWKKGKRWLS